MTPEWSWPDAFFREQLPALADEGRLSRELMHAFLSEWDERSADPGAVYFSAPLMEVVGRRGGD